MPIDVDGSTIVSSEDEDEVRGPAAAHDHDPRLRNVDAVPSLLDWKLAVLACPELRGRGLTHRWVEFLQDDELVTEKSYGAAPRDAVGFDFDQHEYRVLVRTIPDVVSDWRAAEKEWIIAHNRAFPRVQPQIFLPHRPQCYFDGLKLVDAADLPEEVAESIRLDMEKWQQMQDEERYDNCGPDRSECELTHEGELSICQWMAQRLWEQHPRDRDWWTRILEVALDPQLVGVDKEEEEHKRRAAFLWLRRMGYWIDIDSTPTRLDPFTDWVEDLGYEPDRELAMLLVQAVPNAFEFLPDVFRDDDQIASLAVQTCGRALQFASERLRDDKTIVSLALQQDRDVLWHASWRLRDDREIVLLALKNDTVSSYCLALSEVSDRLKCDRSLMLEAVKSHPHIVAIRAYPSDPNQAVFQPYRGDLELLEMALRKDGTVLDSLVCGPSDVNWIDCIPYEYRKKLALVAVEQISVAFWHIRSSLVHDPDVLRTYRASVARTRRALAKKRGLPAETFLALERPREVSILAGFSENEVRQKLFPCSCCILHED